MPLMARIARQAGRDALALSGPISISRFDRDDSTRLQARALSFVCEGCNAALRPVFHPEHVQGRLNSRQSHLRLLPATDHEVGCLHFVLRGEPGNATSHELPGVSRRRHVPSIFVDEPAGSELRPAKADESTSGPGRAGSSRGARRIAAGEAIAESRVRHINALCSPYHEDMAGLAHEPLAVPDCAGRRYGEVFHPIHRGLAKGLVTQQARAIFWLPVTRVESFASGIAIPTDLRASDRRRLRLFVHRKLAGSGLATGAMDLLEGASPDRPVTLYILGSFMPATGHHAHVLEPQSGLHVHVEPSTAD